MGQEVCLVLERLLKGEIYGHLKYVNKYFFVYILPSQQNKAKVNNKISEELNQEISDSKKLVIIPLDTGRKLNVYELFIRLARHLSNVAFTFHSHPVSS